MTLSERLEEYVCACFPCIWVQTHEDAEAMREIGELCRRREWRLATWDVDRGLNFFGQTEATSPPVGGTDPMQAIRSITALAQPETTSALLVLKNLHRFLGSAEVVQVLSHQIERGKQDRTFVIVLSPVLQLPPEIERQIVVLQHDLPERSQLLAIAQGLATEPGDLPEGNDLQMLLDASCGLTRFEAEAAFALSLTRHGRLHSQAVWEIKSQTLQKSGLLRLHRGAERFQDLGGMGALKHFCLRALRSGKTSPEHARPRGVLLLSPPGCGKSAFAKALGNETGRPTISLDVGSLMGSLVGQTEEQTRRALQIIEAMAPCTVWIDELEKAFAGVQAGGASDSGVSTRLFGTLLTWLNDRTADCFVVATCNDISKLPPEFARAERFDGVFFLDLPSSKEREAIWDLYVEHFKLQTNQKRPVDDGWTGAEIRSCCRLAAMLDVSLMEAAINVVPVAVTAAESVERLRQWARGRCLAADQPGIYRRGGSATSPASRKLARDPSPN